MTPALEADPADQSADLSSGALAMGEKEAPPLPWADLDDEIVAHDPTTGSKDNTARHFVPRQWFGVGLKGKMFARKYFE